MARPKAFAEQDALHAAMETFWKKGYHHTSMQDLVDSMGINRASLYDTFIDKHTLYLNALERYRDLNCADMAEAVAGADTARAKIHAIFDRAIAETLEDKEHKGCFMTNATLEMLPHYADVQAIVANNFVYLDNTFRQLLNDGITAGEFSATLNVDRLVPFLMSQLSGIRVLGKAIPDGFMLNQVVDTALSCLR
ncbi:TetR/AcrR family transcriptional regulator [Fibrella forsythiae]|uniref:TetR/AcrR family transcriptional regulator n=1 Tax=Fibrella forsythiae TaxID=2817061 RepID=A0ABS3JIU9_9BACT|nr:TetR/AcrR family transcriptional regulator [Fibrella forsythiae]MBO0948797.1 TetR/AcrR family transcriptional regulator [Fibrella forsythiae]